MAMYASASLLVPSPSNLQPDLFHRYTPKTHSECLSGGLLDASPECFSILPRSKTCNLQRPFYIEKSVSTKTASNG